MPKFLVPVRKRMTCFGWLPVEGENDEDALRKAEEAMETARTVDAEWGEPEYDDFTFELDENRDVELALDFHNILGDLPKQFVEAVDELRRDSIKKVIEYLEESEAKHYLESGQDNDHVYAHLQRMKEALRHAKLLP